MTPTVLFLAMALLPAAHAQQSAAPQPEVGVEEHLGATLPLDARFSDEDGKPITLGKLIDKPTILTLNYFRCAGICTPLLNGLLDSLNELKLEPAKDFQVVTVSFDERDLPEMAKMKRANYLKQFRRPFPPAAWRFLTGKSPSIHLLTDAVGFKFKAYGSEFIHAGVIFILSPQGQVTRYMYGTDFPPIDLQTALGEALRGQTRPSVIKSLAFCYTYDPAGRRYIVSVTRLVGAFSVLMVLLTVFLAVFWERKKS
ncbi:MAG: SCO family protein [Elusimicrobia bacterium]|nr:SCO family protein [Elusimicrobiota bacterium]